MGKEKEQKISERVHM